MRKLQLTPVQGYRLKEAHRHASQVLDQVRHQTLEGDALRDMKLLETSVQHLEYFISFWPGN